MQPRSYDLNIIYVGYSDSYLSLLPCVPVVDKYWIKRAKLIHQASWSCNLKIYIIEPTISKKLLFQWNHVYLVSLLVYLIATYSKGKSNSFLN
jgi:hypothetical protein